MSVLDLAKAIETYVPSNGIDPMAAASAAKESFLSQLPPITTISAVLAVAFGIIGVIAIEFGEAKGIDGKGFIDIAKIFAGAIVDSAAVSMTGRKRKP